VSAPVMSRHSRILSERTVILSPDYAARSTDRIARVISSMADENRNFGMREYLHRHAAEHDCRDPAPSVRGHDDEIAASSLGGADDAFVRMVLFDLHGFADDTSCASFLGDALQYALRMRFGARGVLGKSARHFIDPRSRNGIDVERSFHRQGGDFCPDRLGKRQSMAHRPAGKLGAVGWDQNMPIHPAPLSVMPCPARCGIPSAVTLHCTNA